MGNRRPSAPGFLVALLLLGSATALALPAASQADDLSQQVVVRHAASASAADRADARSAAGVILDHQIAGLPGTEVVTVQHGTRAAAIAALNADPEVLFAEPDTATEVATADANWPLQWGLRNTGISSGLADADVDAEEAWPVSRGAGVTVGVVDTGLDSTHPDLAANTVGGQDFVDGTGTGSTDANGHGTHVAGIIAAVQNGIGISGLAPSAKVMPLRAMQSSGNGSSSDAAAAFAYAGAAGLRVVNASFASSTHSEAQSTAIAQYPDTLFVVAAGNDSLDLDDSSGSGSEGSHQRFPCALTATNVLCVGNSDRTDHPSATSDTGATSVDLFAPGTSIISLAPDSSYATMSGTSMAAPLVSAAAALLAAKNPGWTAAQLKSALLTSADHPAALAGLSASGGRLNAARALGVTPDPDGGAPATPTGFAGIAHQGGVTLGWNASPGTDVAGYRIVQQTRSFDGVVSWTPVLETTSTEASINGLINGQSVAYRVLAFDAQGNVSGESATVTLTPGTSPSAPTAGGGNGGGNGYTKEDHAGGGSSSGSRAPVSSGKAPGTVQLNGLPPGITAPTKAKKHGKVTALGFTLAAPSSVVVTLSKRGRKGYRTVLTTTMKLAAGKQTLKAYPRLLGRRLSHGLWRVVVTNGNAVTFNIKA